LSKNIYSEHIVVAANCEDALQLIPTKSEESSDKKITSKDIWEIKRIGKEIKESIKGYWVMGCEKIPK